MGKAELLNSLMHDFSSEMEDIIEEPSLDASQCSFLSPNSETVKYYYTLKYPNTYSLPRRKILDLLKNKEVYSDLEQSVSSYINSVRKVDAQPIFEASSSPTKEQRDQDIITIFNKSSTPEVTMNRKGSWSENIPILREVVISPAELSMYDSVHSINVPVNCRNEKTSISEVVFDETSICSAVIEIPYSTGLVIKRLNKPVRSKILGTRRPRFGRNSLAPLGGNQAKNIKNIVKMTNDCHL